MNPKMVCVTAYIIATPLDPVKENIGQCWLKNASILAVVLAYCSKKSKFLATCAINYLDNT